jgi:hypothetical protein
MRSATAGSGRGRLKAHLRVSQTRGVWTVSGIWPVGVMCVAARCVREGVENAARAHADPCCETLEMQGKRNSGRRPARHTLAGDQPPHPAPTLQHQPPPRSSPRAFCDRLTYIRNAAHTAPATFEQQPHTGGNRTFNRPDIRDQPAAVRCSWRSRGARRPEPECLSYSGVTMRSHAPAPRFEPWSS